MTDPLTLASEFPPATHADWRKLVDAVLKGAPFDKKLVSRSYDGLRIEPLLPRRADARPIPGRAPAAPWIVMQRVDHPDPAKANAEALHDLENGARGLSLVFSGAIGAYGYGLDASEATLRRALDGVHLDAGVAIELDVSPQNRAAPELLAALVKARGIDPAATDIRFGHDPLAAMAFNGGGIRAWRDLAPTFAKLTAGFAAQGFKGPLAAVDGRAIHNAGGSEAQELAFVLSVAVADLRALEAHGVTLDAARRMIFFRLSADADQFLTIAKFRALRKLWARVEEACGLKPQPAFVAAETAWRMMSKRDPHVNMLRTTIAAFSAGLGGADAVTVLPFTLAIGLPDRFARRVARNAQLILLEESNLARVADPAAGSGGFEDLTDKLCAAAWSLFQEIEKTGGAAAALESGLIQKKVAAVRAERQKAVATRREPLTGTSDYPNLAEAPIAVFDLPQVPAQPFDKAMTFEPLRSLRLAEPFEALRDRSDALLARTGARPKVFLANLGAPSNFTARATFAKSFFESGGIEALAFLPSPLAGEGGEHEDARAGRGVLKASDTPLPPATRATSPARGEVDRQQAALIAAFKNSGAKLACLCSSDEVYAKEAVATAGALKKAGARVYLAGRPGEREAAYRAAGIEGFIFAACDALAILGAAHDIIE